MPDNTPPKLPCYDDALETILARVAVLEVERVALSEAPGRVLRQPVTADRDQPPFHRAAMDGFAVRSAAVAGGAAFDIVADVPAGATVDPAVDLSRGVARIATGAAVPDAFDAVIQIELARVQGGQVRFDVDACQPWRNIHRRGSDARAGDVLLRPGRRLTPPRIGIAAAVGCAELPVTRRPRVVLLTTGDEIIAPQTPHVQPHQVRNCNAPMLAALLVSWGWPMLRHEHVPDEPGTTRDAARRALDEADVVLTTGGVSVGQRDYLPRAWEQLGLQTVLHGVAIQPGKPLFVAQPAGANRLVIGLPGNPVSVLMTALLFVQPVLRRLLGLDAALPWRPRPLAQAVRPNPNREAFRAARPGEGERIEVIAWHGSGDLSHTAEMRGVARLPLQAAEVPAGATVMYLPLSAEQECEQ